jgi:hypothetical protein
MKSYYFRLSQFGTSSCFWKYYSINSHQKYSIDLEERPNA